MLQRMGNQIKKTEAVIPIKDASFPAFFYDGLQYSPPARGTWNIVHTNMLVPESHQIYICALGCLRGVVLTAAEMGAMNRFSSIVVEEHHLYDGTMEDMIVQAVGEILNGLRPYVPRACFLYPSCIHHFMGCDMDDVYRRLRETYTQTKFVACWMDPIRRESDLTAEMRTRRQLYSLLQKTALRPGSVNIVGSNLAVQKECELLSLLQQNGIAVHQLPSCDTYEAYEAMAASRLNIGQEPLAKGCLTDMKERLGQEYIYISNSWDMEDIEKHLQAVAARLHIACPSYAAEKKQCEEALAQARRSLGAMPIAIDYTAVTRPFSLARLLLSHGFAVERIYADGASSEDEADFYWIQSQYPQLQLYATRHADMRCLARTTEGPILAIGQKAAYFTGTKHFVNIVEGSGLRDYAGILRLAALLQEAYHTEKEAKPYISRKGWGCASCL